MKKRVILLLLLTFVFTAVLGIGGMNPTSVTAAPSFQALNFVSATVTASVLNVRQGPSTKFPVVCMVRKGQTVNVFGKMNDWYAIYEPGTGCVGAVSAQFIKINWPAAPAKSPAPVPSQKPTSPAPNPSVTPAPSVNPAPSQAPAEPPADVSADEQKVLQLVNQARADAGIGALQFDALLLKVARLKAKDMVDNRYFSHQSPTYGSPFDMMRQFGVSFKTAGENIAGNQTPEGAFQAWMKSEGHRKNILNGNFNYTGIGVVSSPTYGKMFVQMFIGR